ncbi:MAG TPA: hypothetical protein VMH24_03015, partial [Candidatus Sulfotelmatobacter sp.]|nr:hypothetical protein [Candidatus Sulfotelmatobacter sp.]
DAAAAVYRETDAVAAARAEGRPERAATIRSANRAPVPTSLPGLADHAEHAEHAEPPAEEARR